MRKSIYTAQIIRSHYIMPPIDTVYLSDNCKVRVCWVQWDGARGRRTGGRAMEQRNAVGQIDGYSLVTIDHRQTVEQGNAGCCCWRFLLSSILMQYAINMCRFWIGVTEADIANFHNQFPLDSFQFCMCKVNIFVHCFVVSLFSPNKFIWQFFVDFICD